MIFPRASLIVLALASLMGMPVAATMPGAVVARADAALETPAAVFVDRARRATTTTQSGGTRTVTSTHRSSSTSTGLAAHQFDMYGQVAYMLGGVAAVGAALV